jgi:hypothetical protein
LSAPLPLRPNKPIFVPYKNIAKMKQFRILHRYLGYFLSGVMTMYAVSGIILIFRDTDFLKYTKKIEQNIKPQTSPADLGKALERKNLKITKEENGIIYFENGTYNKETGFAQYTLKEQPFFIKRLTHLHTARSGDPLFFFNVFFGLSLFFFVLSSFWMFQVNSSIFKKGMLYVLAGVAMVLALIFLA